jgi:outer membrane protein assembly factor BamB
MLILSAILPIVFGDNARIIKEKNLKSYNFPYNQLNCSLMESAWPMYCHDERHTGRSPYGRDGNYGVVKWKTYIGDILKSSPAIDKNGTIYIGSGDWELFAINPNGTEKWRFKAGGAFQSSPAIAEDGTIYIGSDDDFLYAINSDGTKKWKLKIGAGSVYSSPVIDENGIIYVASTIGKNICAIYPNGAKKWNFKTGNYIYKSPALDNNILYILSYDLYLYAIYKENGTVKWKFKTNEWGGSDPTIDDDGIIYFGSCDRYLYALYPNGDLKWKFSVGWDALTSSPALGIDGNIYFGCHAGYIYSLNLSNGKENWRYPTNGEVSKPVAIDNNSIIYAGDWDGVFYALNPDGAALWKFKTNNPIMVSPVIAEDGTVYIASWDGYLYALEIIEIHNEPPIKPTLDGPSEGKAREEYTFTANTTDPDGHKISYFFDWEYEHENSGWLDFIPSGTTININQTFYLEGTYTVKVKAQDRYGADSLWETLEIKITNPRVRISSYHWLFECFPLLERILSLILGTPLIQSW